MKETRPRWQRSSTDIEFKPDDFDILDLTLNYIPELRICALAIKRARAAQVRYPLETADKLIGLLDDGQRFVGAGHRIKAEHVRAYMPQEFFPIEDESDLISKIYLALLRCKHEFAIAARVHPITLAELSSLTLSSDLSFG